LLSVNMVRPARAAAEREPRKDDRTSSAIGIPHSTAHTVAANPVHHAPRDRAWWREEARRVGSDWSGVLALRAEVVAAWRRRHDPDYWAAT
jgi:hypothetical protein